MGFLKKRSIIHYLRSMYVRITLSHSLSNLAARKEPGDNNSYKGSKQKKYNLLDKAMDRRANY